MKILLRFVGIFVFAAVLTCCAKALGAIGLRQSRLSAAVALTYQGKEIESFLNKPDTGYVQAYARFDSTMPDDVIIAIDQEFYDGTANPKFVSGGDWMSFVGIQRAGGLWVPAGNDSTMSGNPSTDREWKIIDLQVNLKPDVWYRLRVESNFATRHFKSFTIEGGGINKTVDLSQYPLDYPNKIPFVQRAMGYFVCAIRSRDMMKVEGTPIVYFDDVEGVVNIDGSPNRVFFDGFETQPDVPRQPAPTSSIDLKSYQQAKWYLERDDSIISTQSVPFAKSGSRVGVADANLN
jgi:hypothetical protein